MNTFHRLIVSSVLLGASAASAWSQTVLAPTPPMGWNSWDSFGTGVTEAEVKANADYMARYMAKSGWQYIVVDIQWSEPNPKSHGYRPGAELVMDANGRLTPAPSRFPSAADGRGFKPVATNAASVMCRTSWKLAGFSIAAIGSISVNLPSTSLKPAGAFIQALAVTTKMPEKIPLTATIIPETQCSRGDRRFQP